MLTPPQPEVPTVTVDEAAQRLAAGVRVIDVREEDEWDTAHVAGMELRPMSAINDWYQDLDPDEEVLVMCRSGARSGRVVASLIEQAGFTNAHNVGGGILAWAQAELPVESGD